MYMIYGRLPLLKLLFLITVVKYLYDKPHKYIQVKIILGMTTSKMKFSQ